MRKAFNFYSSYYEVAKMLSNEDRLAFFDALLKKQFTGQDTDLSSMPMANFAYVGQKHNIDAQVKGWEDKAKVKLSDLQAITPPFQPPSEGGIEPPCQPPSVQEKEKEKEKEYNIAPKVAQKTIEQRKKDFELKIFTDDNLKEYSDTMLVNFFEYWSEHGENDRKMRFEKQTSYDLSKRLKTWKRNDFGKSKPTRIKLAEIDTYMRENEVEYIDSVKPLMYNTTTTGVISRVKEYRAFLQNQNISEVDLTKFKEGFINWWKKQKG